MIFNATTISGRAIISLDQPLSSDPDSDTIEDKIGADLSEDPMQIVSSKELLGVAKDVMQQLSPKEAAILRLRFGLVDDVSSDDSYNLTREEVTSISEGHGLT